MPVTRFKLPFGKMPSKFNGEGIEQWRDYCAVTDVNSDKPDEVVLIDLVLTGITPASLESDKDISVATAEDLTEHGIEIGAKVGLPLLVTEAGSK